MMKANLLPLIACGILNCALAFGEEGSNVIDEAGAAVYIPTENIVALGAWNEVATKENEICLGYDWASCTNTTHNGRPLCISPGLSVKSSAELNLDEVITAISFDEVEIGVPHKEFMAEAKPLKKRRGVPSVNSVGYEGKKS